MPFTTAQLPFVPEGICRHCEQTDVVICCIKHNCDTICDRNYTREHHPEGRYEMISP
jgi:hypothetical protein